MSTQYAGNPAAAWPDDYSIPDDGDPRTAASVNVAFEALGDRTAILQAQVWDRWYRVSQAPVDNVSARFEFNGIHEVYTWNQTSVADVGDLIFSVNNLPRTGTITKLRARWWGASELHPVGVPATVPIAVLVAETDVTSDDLVSISPDTSSVAAYETLQTTTSAVIAHSISDATHYLVSVTGETGANSIAGAFSVFWLEVYVEAP